MSATTNLNFTHDRCSNGDVYLQKHRAKIVHVPTSPYGVNKQRKLKEPESQNEIAVDYRQKAGANRAGHSYESHIAFRVPDIKSEIQEDTGISTVQGHQYLEKHFDLDGVSDDATKLSADINGPIVAIESVKVEPIEHEHENGHDVQTHEGYCDVPVSTRELHQCQVKVEPTGDEQLCGKTNDDSEELLSTMGEPAFSSTSQLSISNEEKKMLAGLRLMADVRKRKCRFSPREFEALIDGIEDNYHILKGKACDLVTNAKKNDAWRKVATRVNAVTNVFRSVAELRKKWEDSKSRTKKHVCEIKKGKALTKMGGGKSTVKGLTQLEKRIIKLISDETLVCGLHDQTNTVAKEDDNGYELMTVDDNVSDSSNSKYRERMTKTARKCMESKASDYSKEILEVQKERLLVEKCRLEIEERRLQIEERRLQIEERRLQIEETRLERDNAPAAHSSN